MFNVHVRLAELVSGDFAEMIFILKICTCLAENVKDFNTEKYEKGKEKNRTSECEGKKMKEKKRGE